MTTNRKAGFLAILLATGMLGACARYAARNTINAAGITYSEVSFIQKACTDNTLAVLMFLKSGMSPNARGINNGTALGCAAQGDHVRLVRLLIAHGADVNSRNKYGETPLMWAASRGQIRIIKVLLDAGANVNEADKNGDTPLLLAAGAMCHGATCNPKVVDLLLAHGANPKVRNTNDENALAKMLKDAYGVPDPQLLQATDTLIRLGAGPDTTVGPYQHQPLLTFVASRGDTQVLERLIRAGADVNTVGKNTTPLIAAARWPNEVRELLAAKADPNLTSSSGTTPLMAAVHEGAVGSAKLLLAAGADPNPVSPGSSGPLDAAIQNANVALVALLLKYPVDVNAANSQGQTPLHILASWGTPISPQALTAIARMLLKRGAHRNALNQQGETAADLALNRGLVKLASVIAGRKLTAKRDVGVRGPVIIEPWPWVGGIRSGPRIPHPPPGVYLSH
ncbi:MAG: ankyrin repeat domain-containing protein [Gammaproteobacteria bacterium]